jgi:hypothetical protein
MAVIVPLVTVAVPIVPAWTIAAAVGTVIATIPLAGIPLPAIPLPAIAAVAPAIVIPAVVRAIVAMVPLTVIDLAVIELAVVRPAAPLAAIATIAAAIVIAAPLAAILSRLDRVHRLGRSRADIVVAIALPAIAWPALAAPRIALPGAAIVTLLRRHLNRRLRHRRGDGSLRLRRRRTGTAIAAIPPFSPEFVPGILVLGIGRGRHRRDCGGGQQSCPDAFHLVSPLCGKRACPSLTPL